MNVDDEVRRELTKCTGNERSILKNVSVQKRSGNKKSSNVQPEHGMPRVESQVRIDVCASFDPNIVTFTGVVTFCQSAVYWLKF